MTLILLETVENVQALTSVYVGIESKKNPTCVEKLTWLNPYTATFNVPSKLSLPSLYFLLFRAYRTRTLGVYLSMPLSWEKIGAYKISSTCLPCDKYIDLLKLSRVR